MSSSSVTPWYKQFWPWFLLGLLFSSIAFSLLFLFFSIRYYDGSISGDYYERGLGINEQLAKQEHANELGLSATLKVDNVTGDVVINLAGERRPETLHLALIFPTDGDFDRELTLTHVREGRYVGTIEEPLQYRWYLQLQPEAGDAAEWRLTGEARFPSEDEANLVPGI
ncbi:FixH family protein [Halomonas vilamensis]|uniref:FixH family protein n=1 Tax=Vreelandella vilamensis TaxID=531309 RepID=A0ABU1GZU4_9GAMM|nr:FixH family protein [Halomonas vilamensis]MDR5897504.1 FixH family protein [Halomonas vilamensis]